MFPKITERDRGGKNCFGENGPWPLVAEVLVRPGEDIHPIVIHKIGDKDNGYMPTDEDLKQFRDLLLAQSNNKSGAIIMHYGLDVALEFIPTWLIKLDNMIRKIKVKFFKCGYYYDFKPVSPVPEPVIATPVVDVTTERSKYHDPARDYFKE